MARASRTNRDSPLLRVGRGNGLSIQSHVTSGNRSGERLLICLPISFRINTLHLSCVVGEHSNNAYSQSVATAKVYSFGVKAEHDSLTRCTRLAIHLILHRSYLSNQAEDRLTDMAIQLNGNYKSLTWLKFTSVSAFRLDAHSAA